MAHSRTSRMFFRRTLLLAASLASVLALAGGVLVAQAGPAAAADTATINGATTFQTITGFGASEAFGEAQTVMNASSSVQQQALGLLYSPASGAGLTMLRNWISADSGSTIEPNNPGGPAATPTYLPMSQTSQDAGQLWFAQQIKADYGVSNVFADAWSAPAFMKTNGSASGGGAVCGSPGATCSSGDWRQAYANYLVQYAKDYSAAGVPLSYIGPENEANLSTSYDSMQMSPAQTANLLDVLGPTLASSGLPVKMECCATEGWDFRIAATSSNSGVDISAFKNTTDGTVAIVALNTGTSADPITYSLSGTGTPNGATVTPYLTNSANDVAAQAATSVSGGSFSGSIPARSLVTYVVGASGSGGGNTVTVTNPGNQTGTVGTAESVQIHAADSGTGQTLTYGATGLPAGLSINSSTGLISGTPTAAATSTVTVTATDGTGASGSATFTWTISGSGGGGGCKVAYATQSQWAGGFVAGVTITNTGSSAISGWTLKFTFPGDQKITNAWNGQATQSGEAVSITNESYNGTIAPGANTSLGFQGTWTSSDAVPAAFTLNGTACTT